MYGNFREILQPLCLGIAGSFMQSARLFVINCLNVLSRYVVFPCPFPENSNPWLLIAVLLLCAVPMILDGGSQLIFPYNSPEPLRFVTGLIFGYFRGCILLSVLSVLLHTAVAKLRRLA